MAGKAGFRRDSKHRVLRRGESIRADGKYQFKYHVGGNHTSYIVGDLNQRIHCQLVKSHVFR